MADEKVIDLARLDRFHSNLKSNGLPMNDWQANKKYKVGYVVMYNGNQYRCTVEHTSTSTFDTSKWELTSSPGGVDLPEWQPNTSYTAGKYLVHEGTVYKVDNDFTSGTTFSDANLTSYIAPIMQGATSSADGKAGMVIKPTTTDINKFLKGDGTWGDAGGGGGGISVWQANTSYSVNDVVIDNNLIWQCATAHTSTSTFDESKWVCISGGEISNGLEIVDLWSGSYSTYNNSSDYTSFSYTQTISDSIANYDYLVITTQCNTSNVNNNIFNTSDAINHDDLRCSIFANNSYNSALSIMFVDNTTFGISWSTSVGFGLPSVVKIQGIRKAKPIVSSGMKYETLWEGEAGSLSGSSSGMINLGEPVNTYKKIGIYLVAQNNNGVRPYYREMNVEQYLQFLLDSLSGSTMSFCWGYASNNDYFDIQTGSSNNEFIFFSEKTVVTKVIGISEGVTIPTGVQAARVTLWEGSYNTSNESESNLTNTITLNDSITNYDCVEITFAGSGSRDNIVTEQYDVSNYIVDDYAIVSFGHSNMYADMNFKFVDDTHFAIMYKRNYTWDGKILKIIGIKYIQPDSYSTEEKLIGTWIDGKPLYRKVFENPTNGMNTGLNNVDYYVTKIYGRHHNINDGAVYMFPSDAYGLWITPSGIVVTSGNQALDYIAIEYTKN